MKGLILKDFLVARKTLKTYGLFLLAYFAMGMVGIFPMSICISMGQVIVMMVPIAAFSYDEMAHWNLFAAALPGGRGLMVRARYAFAMVIMLMVSAYNLVVTVLMSILQKGMLIENLATMAGALAVGILIISIMMPLNYKLGRERATPFLYVVIFVPIIVAFGAAKLGLLEGIISGPIPDEAVYIAVAALLVVVIGLFLVSYFVSCRIMKSKQF